MQLSGGFDCSLGAIRIRVALLYLVVLIRILWTKRDPGMASAVSVVWCFLKCCFGIVVTFYFIGHRAWAVFSLHAFMRSVDNSIDGDWAMPRGMTLTTYLAQKDCLFENLRLDKASLSLRPEDIFLVCLVREGRRCGFDFIAQLQSIWQWYRADVERQRQGQFPASLDAVECPAAKANVEFFTVFFSIMGGQPHNQRWVIEEAVTIFMICDVLHDLIDDLRKGIAWLPTQSLAMHHVSLTDLVPCHNWQQAAAVAGLKQWYRHEVENMRQRWDSLRSQLPQAMKPLLPDCRIRRLFIRTVAKQFEFFIRRCELRAHALTSSC